MMHTIAVHCVNQWKER